MINVLLTRIFRAQKEEKAVAVIKPLQRRGSASGQINPVQPRGRPSEDVARRRAGRDSIPGPSDQNYNGEYKN